MGELASLGAAVSWAIAICLYARWGYGITAWGLNLFKCAVALAGLLLVLIATVEWPSDPRVIASLSLSGFLGIAVGDTASYGALQHLGPLASAAGVCLGPPFAAVLGYLLLGETLEPLESAGIVLTLIGVLGVLLGTERAVERPYAIPLSSRWRGIAWLLLSGAGHAAGVVAGRHGMQQTDVLLGTTIRLVPATLFLLALCRWKGHGLWLGASDRRRLGYLLLAAVTGSFIGLTLMSIGLKLTKAGVAAALYSTYPIWVVPISRFVLGERVPWRAAAFTCLACLGCALILA